MQATLIRQCRSTQRTRQRIPDFPRRNRGIDGLQKRLIVEDDIHE
jgi:hypothetical protein